MKGENMFKVEKCEPETRMEIKYPHICVRIGRQIGINGRWTTYVGHGNAKCNKDDKFNKDFGIELAKVRAWMDLLKIYEGELISLTKEPEWRKKKNIRINQEIFEEASLYIDTHPLRNIKTIRVCNMDGKVLGIAKVEE